MSANNPLIELRKFEVNQYKSIAEAIQEKYNKVSGELTSWRIFAVVEFFIITILTVLWAVAL